VLLEKKIIFVSQSRTVLGYAIEAFLAFVFPFRWEHVLIPILPAPLKEYITAPVPLIVGISPAMVDHTI
jgi:DENN domain-containing protein 1